MSTSASPSHGTTEVQIHEAELRGFNQERADAFCEKMLAILNAGGLSLMTSIGHRAGLFDVMSGMPAATSQEIADRAGLQERYVREWLGAMVVGGIVEHDPALKTYRLPPEHAAFLTRAAIPNNLAGMAQWIGVLGQVEDKILNRFHQGGGVCYEEFHRFHEVMAEESGQTTVWAIVDQIVPLVPGLRERLESGIDVLDVGCGAGRAMIRLAQEFPHSRFSGIDLCDDAIAMARERARELGLSNLRFETMDDTQIAGQTRFDLITAFDTVHDQANPAALLASIHRLLKPKGVLLMQDIGVSSHVEKNVNHPIGALIYTVSCMHCMTVSLAQGGAGLGACWGEELALKMLREAGFGPVTVHRLPHDILNSYFVVQRD